MSKMKELSIIISGQTDPIHKRLLKAQKDIKALRDATYADHRLMVKMDKALIAQRNLSARLTKRIRKLETDT